MNWKKLRNCFPVTKSYVYLDHASMSPLSNNVFEALNDFQLKRHMAGRDFTSWWEETERVRHKLAALIGAEAEEIAFTESTSHGINIVAQGLDWQPGDNIIIGDLEFPANVYPWLNLQSRGVEIRFAENVDGAFPVEAIAGLIDQKTRLVAISHVQACNGYRSDLNRLGRLCSEKKVFFMVDAIQSLGAFPVDVQKNKIDFLAAAAFKWLLGPDGLGFIYCRKSRLNNLNLSYLGWSGMNQRNNFMEYRIDLPAEARRFELGNLNYSAIYGLSAALDFINEIGVEAISKRLVELIGFVKAALAEIPEVVNRSRFAAENLGGIITFDLPHREEVHAQLTEKGFITALRHNGIRVSPHFYTTKNELADFADTIKRLVRKG